MKMQKKVLRLFAALLCVFLLVTLAACDQTNDTSTDSNDSSGDATPETPKTNAEKFLDALNSYETYFNDISEAFGTKLPAVSDHGTADLKMTIPVFSVFGESQTDVFDADKPVLQATIVQAGDLASMALTAMLYDEQMHLETYESAKEAFLVFPDLPDQAPIRLTADEAEEGAGSGVINMKDAFKKLLDGLGDASEDATSYLTVTEDGDTCTYALRLTAKQVTDLVKNSIIDEINRLEGLDISSFEEESDAGYMLIDLTTVSGLPTELHISLYDEGETEAAAEFDLKTSVTGSTTKINGELSSSGDTLLTVSAAITATQGSIAVNAALDMEGVKLTANVKLLSETENSVKLDGTVEMRMDMEGGAAVTLPLTVSGQIRADGDAREMEMELSSSSTGMFDITLRYEVRFTPGETSVTMPEGAVEADQVDSDALMEALAEAYPQIFGVLLGGEVEDWVDSRSYMTDDMTVFADVYEDDTIELTAFLDCVDNGKSLTFSYNGKTLGSYAYTVTEDGFLEGFGMLLASDPHAEDYGCEKILSSADDGIIGIEIDIYEDGAVVGFCLPFETVDGVTKILLPDGTALPFDVILPEDETSPLKIGTLTLPRYVESDLV